MAIWRSKEGLEGLGDHDLAERQPEILAEAKRRHPGFTDIPLTGRFPQESGSRFEAVSVALSPETRKLVEHMRGNGYAVYDTTGRTPVSLKADGMRYWVLSDKLAERTAAPALLAFKRNPSEFFLPGSHNIPHEEQVKLIPDEQTRVEKQYSGMGLVVREGKVSEWTELAWKNFQETRVRIFGRDFGFNWTWADDYESDEPGANRAFVGYWDEADGLDVYLLRPGIVYPLLGLASLVEIPRK